MSHTIIINFRFVQVSANFRGSKVLTVIIFIHVESIPDCIKINARHLSAVLLAVDKYAHNVQLWYACHLKVYL